MFGRRFIGGQGYGLVADTVLGVLGGIIGAWVATAIFGSATVGALIAIVVAVAGAAALVSLVRSSKSRPASG